ncbi:hypothetical protein PACTADRAFT_73531 [Pachysolen tannophilus NRRL Y-2460]|uniref:Protein GLC8 n=1 Tax=Pachysolen tannophilus NRRL Y-2460 TaxID=669874 RepID=A0A1E4U1H2_PACTA|nr:hypothetical protein PACTADRAFT_73531 [Pachysolen tannophilus NRRL Y-2460]
MSESNSVQHQPTPKGILRNAPPEGTYEQQRIDITKHLDRQKVLENTRLNAKLHALAAGADTNKDDRIRQKIAEQKAKQKENNTNDSDQNGLKEGEHLKWDEVNLYLTEQEKCATMKIDEPKTPYEGGVDPNNDYYRNDNEEDDLDDFKLGEPEVEPVDEEEESLSGGTIIKDPNYKEDEEADEEQPKLSAEERHKKFEQMRKEHYHLKGNVLKQPIQVSDEEEE